MSEHLRWTVGNRNPSIEENLVYADGTPVDLTGTTVYFQGREVGGTALLVNGTAQVVGTAVAGNVRYDWTDPDITLPAGILASPRRALVWWKVKQTSGGREQDYGEALIEVFAHVPGQTYVELEEFKSSSQLTGFTFLDLDAERCLEAASRAVDDVTHRRFWPDTDAQQVRWYTPNGALLEIDDLLTLTSVEGFQSGGTSVATVWQRDRDYVLEPLNAEADDRPYETIRRIPTGAYPWPGYPRSVRVTGKFGWSEAPAGVKQAVSIIASRVLKRVREAPFGVVTVGLEGEAYRIARNDPDVSLLLQPYTRTEALIG